MLLRTSSFKGSFIDGPSANFSSSEEQLSTAQRSRGHSLQTQVPVSDAPADTWAAQKWLCRISRAARDGKIALLVAALRLFLLASRLSENTGISTIAV